MTSSNPLSGGKKRVRMRDVAARCGVSVSTVSLVLSGDPRIPEDTARKVLQTVKAMEYRPSVIARSLARRGSRTIGVILPEFAFQSNRAFYYQSLEGIHAQTQPSGYKLVVEAANRVFLERRYYLRLLKEQSADGMIYMAASVSDRFLSDMTRENYPFALLANGADDVDLPCVKTDDFIGAQKITEYLISMGHKEIGHITGHPDFSPARDRELGYREAMKKAGLTVNPAWVTRGDFDMKKAEEATTPLLQAKVSAIFAGCDTMAIGAMRQIHTQGLSIPNDISVAGMDNIEMAEWVIPGLTTVDYDFIGLAGMAAKHVLKQVQNPVLQKLPVEQTPEPKIIERQSCAPKK